MMMGRITIAIYRPKKGCEKALGRLVDRHMDVLKAEDLITTRKPVVMRAADGSIVEIFEWKSAEAIQEAHHNKAVGELWTAFSEVCDYLPPAAVDEFHKMFSEFEAIN